MEKIRVPVLEPIISDRFYLLSEKEEEGEGDGDGDGEGEGGFGTVGRLEVQ